MGRLVRRPGLSREIDGTTVIGGPIADQAALHGLLQKVRDVGLPLVSVTYSEPSRLEGPSDLDGSPTPKKESPE